MPPAVDVPPGAAGAGGPQGALPVYGGASALSKIFNPDIAVIGNFLGAAGENTIDPAPALEMHEAEAEPSRRSSIRTRARTSSSRRRPKGLEIEEGFLTFTSLPGGLLAKVGKMKQQFGKVNTLHAHTLPWVDAPLVMKNLLGGEEGLNDSGVSVSKLMLNPWFFLEATGEVYQGNSGSFQSHERSDVSWLGRLRGYRDITEGTNLDIGASFARGHNDAGPDFTTRRLRRRRDGAVPAAAARHLPPLPRPHRADLEPPRAGSRRRVGVRHVCRAATTSSRAAGSAACATTGRSAPIDSVAGGQGAVVRR